MRADRVHVSETLLVLRHVQPILFGQRRHDPDRLAELPQVRSRQEEAGVLSASKLVQGNEASAQVREGRPGLLGDRVHLLVEGGEFLRSGADLFASLGQFRRAYFALEFKAAHIPEQCPLLSRQVVRFVVQCLQPVGRAARERLGPVSVGILRDKPGHGQGQNDRRGHGEKMAKHPCAAEYSIAMRILGLDVGRRRVGVAISDASATLARPLKTLPVTDADVVDAVTSEVLRLAAEDDGVGIVVVGLPRRLDGSPSEQTVAVQAFIAALRLRLDVPVESEDERLSSREADSRLAVRERDWRKRKANLDAAAAAVILQDYLDRRER